LPALPDALVDGRWDHTIRFTMHELHVAVWSVLPFVGLLLSIALLPLVAEKFWHSNRNRAIVSIGLAIPIVIYLLFLEFAEHQPGLEKLGHAVHEYVDFIAMLAALYTVAGGIVIAGQFRPTPWVNTGFFALGAVLANVIGTTGASMLLIRPLLRINLVRQNRSHLPIFFIILVSNLGAARGSAAFPRLSQRRRFLLDPGDGAALARGQHAGPRDRFRLGHSSLPARTGTGATSSAP
jgi:hypothetical protein